MFLRCFWLSFVALCVIESAKPIGQSNRIESENIHRNKEIIASLVLRRILREAGILNTCAASKLSMVAGGGQVARYTARAKAALEGISGPATVELARYGV